MNVLGIFEIIGTIAFAAAGALVGIQRRLDIFGVLMLALATAVGGGILRDLLIGKVPPTAFMYPIFTIISILTTVATCFTYRWLGEYNKLMLVCDAVGLGAFTAAGANLAFALDYNRLLLTVMMGVLTGVGGGIIRDMLAREIPLVFRREIYAVASLAGALGLFYARPQLGSEGAMYLCFAITVIIRLVSLQFDLHLPVVGRREDSEEI
ncbi:trimeric intracellular cation channel family protein [Azotosporobacter soli]|uniref:trimeric intracellular cation channel family protein n=1 Tax=Azotosporobacter soli TaxID=3055040 RepID=UPI0031FF0E22